MSPSSADLPDRPLAESIAVATRSSHSRLNKSIIARLPMVTSAADPSSYITGLLHIAPIYLTFEACWKSLLEAPSTEDEARPNDRSPSSATVSDIGLPTTATAHTVVQLQKPVVCGRLRTLLQQLRLEGLMRSSRLRADVQALTGWPEHLVEEQMRLAGEMGRLGEFTAHIRRTIEHRPHVLIAYSYILYMALFAGGRFIRATLESTGAAFWSETPSPIKPSNLKCRRRSFDSTESATRTSDSEISPTAKGIDETRGVPLSFFYFATSEDGEDLKREFKGRLLDAENVLSRQEKHEIVQESICIFDNMELLVGQLDKVCAETDVADGNSMMENLSALMGKSMAMRLRDSVAVTKDRAARSSSRMTSSSGNDSDSDSFCTFARTRKGHGTDAATSTTGLSSISVPGHPIVPPTMGATELCPAMKSMRFESNLPIPLRAATEATEGMKDYHYTNWLLMAAFGAIIVGAIMTTRKEMLAA